MRLTGIVAPYILQRTNGRAYARFKNGYHTQALISISYTQATLITFLALLGMEMFNKTLHRPKGRKRRIYGHQQNIVQIVQEGPVLAFNLGAHLQHPSPLFNAPSCLML
jgi:hypothetical protein